MEEKILISFWYDFESQNVLQNVAINLTLTNTGKELARRVL